MIDDPFMPPNCKPLKPKIVQYQNVYKMLYSSLSEPDAPYISKDGPYRMKNGEMVADSA